MVFNTTASGGAFDAFQLIPPFLSQDLGLLESITTFNNIVYFGGRTDNRAFIYKYVDFTTAFDIPDIPEGQTLYGVVFNGYYQSYLASLGGVSGNSFNAFMWIKLTLDGEEITDLSNYSVAAFFDNDINQCCSSAIYHSYLGNNQKRWYFSIIYPGSWGPTGINKPAGTTLNIMIINKDNGTIYRSTEDFIRTLTEATGILTDEVTFPILSTNVVSTQAALNGKSISFPNDTRIVSLHAAERAMYVGTIEGNMYRVDEDENVELDTTFDGQIQQVYVDDTEEHVFVSLIRFGSGVNIRPRLFRRYSPGLELVQESPDADNVARPGEIIPLKLTVRNIGTSLLRDITLFLTIANGFVHVSDTGNGVAIDPRNGGTVFADDRGWANRSIRFTIGELGIKEEVVIETQEMAEEGFTGYFRFFCSVFGGYGGDTPNIEETIETKNITPTVTPNEIVEITLTPSNYDYDANLRTGNDIRFEDLQGNLLPFFREEWNYGGESLFQVRVPQAGTDRIIMRYSGDVFETRSNADDVAAFSSSFQTEIDTNAWTVVGTPTIDNGFLLMDSNGDKLTSIESFSFDNYEYLFRRGNWAGERITLQGTDGTSYLRFGTLDGAGNFFALSRDSAGNISNPGAITLPDAVDNVVRFVRVGGEFRLYHNNVLFHTFTSNLPSPPYNIVLEKITVNPDNNDYRIKYVNAF